MKPIRPIWLMMLLAMGWAATAHAMDDWELRHLLTRVGFGVTADQYARFKPMTYEQAVDALLAEDGAQPVVAPPDWVREPPPSRAGLRQLPADQRRERQRQIQQVTRQHSQELKVWWYRQMLATPAPLTERMTLFWANHFTSSLQKVRIPQLLWSQNQLLRSMALGNFHELVQAVATDPAMIIYLDNANNRVGQPNENFARELMELFTQGEGHYTERDINQPARAFTGWHVNRLQGTFFFDRRRHDDGNKVFMGHGGDLNGNDIIDILFTQPALATYIAGKLCREFVSPTPDPKEVARLADIFRRSNYEIKPLLRAILMSPAFRDPAGQGTLVKSPVDLMVGTLRTFGAGPDRAQALVRYGRQLGQDLFSPPNVKGWPGGDAWIDSNTLLIRRQIVDQLAGPPDPDRREMTGAAMRPAMPELTAQQRDLLRQVTAMRRQGMQRTEIATRLQAMGQDPRQTLDLVLRVAQARGGGRGRNNMMAMPRLDPADWMKTLIKEGMPAADARTLLLPLPPVESPDTMQAGDQPSAQLVSEWLHDPVFELK